MLVCNVALRARRTVAADLAEIAAALDHADTLGIGQLVSEAASAGDSVNAAAVYAAAILEAAAAATVQDAAGTGALTGDIIETAGAAAAQDAAAIYSTAILEAATAASVEGGAVVGVATTVAFDPVTVANVTLSGGNLVATSTGTSSTDQGARVAGTSGKEFGKYYFEDTFTAMVGPGPYYGIGVGGAASTYTGMGSGQATGGAGVLRNGAINSDGVYTGIIMSSPGPQVGDVIGVAVDLDNRKIWFRRNGLSWNENATYDPATNVGGVALPAGTMVPIATFGGGIATGQVQTANFGATGFAYAVPSGFTSGWPLGGKYASALSETASAASTQDGTVPHVGGVARAALAGTVQINSDGTARQANADGIMLNL